MCEFKVINAKTNEQLCEDVVVLNYSEDSSLILRDILGAGNKLDSAFIYEVNTLNQTSVVVEHPLVKPFIKLIGKLSEKKASKADVEDFEELLRKYKNSL